MFCINWQKWQLLQKTPGPQKKLSSRVLTQPPKF